MARLRRVIAQIEAEAGPAGERLAQRFSLAPSFDSALGGGLADDALHEIAPAQPADGAAAMGFALALAARFLSQRPASALVISEGFAAEESGALYGPGLVAHGLSLSRLVFVRAPDAALAFWAIEEALKSGAPGVVVGEIWSLKGYSLVASRRLLLAARKGKVPALLILASAYGQAERLSSAAETRFEIAAAPSATIPAAAGPDLPGPFACGARLVKSRLARAGPFVDADSPSKDGRSSERPMDSPSKDGRSSERPMDSPSKDGRSSERPMDSPSKDGRSSERPIDGVRDQRSRLQAHDPGRLIRLEWRSQDMTFEDMTFQDLACKDMAVDDQAISLPLAAASGDRSRAAARRY
jgi:protein ImuA